MTIGEIIISVFIAICVCYFIYEKFIYRKEQIGLSVKFNHNEPSETNEYNNYLTDKDKAYRLWKSLLDKTCQDKINWKYNLDEDRNNNYAVNKRDYEARVNGVIVEVQSDGYLFFDGNYITSDTEIKNFMDLHYEISTSIDRKEIAAMEKDKEKSIKKFLGNKK